MNHGPKSPDREPTSRPVPVKNQYFGDVNDYRKYGLLRCLAAAGLRMGVCWMLTPDDGGHDGKRLRYLDEPTRWRHHDPPLFDHLRSQVARSDGRHINGFETSGSLPGALFFSAMLHDSMTERSRYFSLAWAALAASEVLFFDPDNGLEVRSVGRGAKTSGKYLYWSEVVRAWESGKSFIIYQHFPRIDRPTFVGQLVSELWERTHAPSTLTVATSHVLFLCVIQAKDRPAVEVALDLVRARWAGQLEPSWQVRG